MTQIRALFVALILGTCLNVASACYFAYSRPIPFGHSRLELTRAQTNRVLLQRCGATDPQAGAYEEHGFGWSLIVAATPGCLSQLHAQVYCAGWPLKSLEGHFALNTSGWSESALLRTNRELNPLPLRPLWLPFALNSAFYGGLLFLAYPLPTAIRRALRKRRGLCPHCSYPLLQSPVCSECGFGSPASSGVA